MFHPEGGSVSIIEVVERAKLREVKKSDSEVVWDGLDAADRAAIHSAIVSGAVGPGKMQEALLREGVKLSRVFLYKMRDGGGVL